MQAKQLIKDLKNTTNDLIEQAESLKSHSVEILNWKETPKSWSILECLEHLNLYGHFYLPEIRKRINTTKHKKAGSFFKPGVLGNYFANSMLPKEGMKKMKTFKDKDPANSRLTTQVIEEFIQQQREMLILMEEASAVNLTKTTTSISISNWIKLRLGDTLRFTTNHNVRHMVQAQNTLKKQQTF